MQLNDSIIPASVLSIPILPSMYLVFGMDYLLFWMVYIYKYILFHVFEISYLV